MDKIQPILIKLSTIPKEYTNMISWGFVFAGIILLLVSFAFGVLYLNVLSKPKAPIRKQPSKANETSVQQKIHYEDLPLISGRIGEILAINGIIKVGPTTKNFLKVLDVLKNSTYDVRWRYKLPCFMIIGPETSGKSTLINSLKSELLTESDVGPMWKLFKHGIIFEFPKSDIAEKKFWSFLSELFLFIRPRRPLDGIIVTLPADFLISENVNIEKIAKDIFENVFQFQRDINFHLPIYVIVTKSDLIPGFTPFAHFLHNDMKQQMFGWSCPYTLNTMFSSKWIAEIFETLNAGINKAILSFAQTRKSSDELTNALLFSAYFNKIKTNLIQYISTMFTAHNPEDGLIFRGIYFVGEQKKIEAPIHKLLEPNALLPKMSMAIDVPLSLNTNQLYFVQDLFLEKIFKESNIAYPIHTETPNMRQLEFKRQMIYISASAVFVFGWLIGNYNIRNKITQYCSDLSEVKTSMEKAVRIENSLNNMDNNQIDKLTGELLHNLPKVKWLDLISIFVPQSWFSSIRKNITETINLAFDSIMVRAIYIDLNLGTQRFLQSTDTGKQCIPKSDLFDINSFYSFKKLCNFSNQIKKTKTMGDQYNSIRDRSNGQELIEISRELFKEQFNNSQISRHTPNKKLLPPRFNIDLFKEHAEKTLEVIFDEFLKDVFDNTILKILQNTTRDIDLLQKAAHNSSAEYSTKTLARLYQKCTLIADLMRNKNFTWVKQEHFIPNLEYTKIINKLRESGFISQNCIRKLLAKSEFEFNNFKEQLRNFRTDITDELLQHDIQNVSEGFENFKKELKFLLDKPFICATPYGQLVTPVPDEKMLIWDQRKLDELSKLIDKYYEFETTIPEEIRQQFFEDYKVIAKKCFYPVIQAFIGSAEIFQDIPIGQSRALLEEAYKTQATNIRKVSVALPKIVKIIDNVQTEDHLPNCGVIQMVISHYLELLERIDTLFNAEKPYSAREAVFSEWTGDNSPKYLNIDSQADLQQYLSMQFEHMKFLAKDLAEPVVDLLSIPTMRKHIQNTALLDKWKTIISGVNDYIQKKPGNSVSALEEFISQTLKQVSIDNFDEKGDISNASETGGDYFMQTRSSVAKSLLSRADEVKYDRAAKVYLKMSDFFNTHLKNKFPFGKSDEDATIKDIESFVVMYETAAKGMEEIFEKYKDLKSINIQSIDFLRELKQLIPFLKTWILHTKGNDINSAVVLFNVQSRPAQNMEAYTSSVVDRNFNINGAPVANASNGVYFNNDTVDVSFKWVDRSNEKPYAQSTIKNLHIDGSLATFKYSGKWAMFRLIDDHKINQEMDNPEGILLKFEVPIVDSNQGNKIFTSMMVLKITPMKKNKDNITPMEWPVFPAIAPNLHLEDQQVEPANNFNFDMGIQQ